MRFNQVDDKHPCCLGAGYQGSVAFQQVWKFPGLRNVPKWDAATPPAFSWKNGYPEKADDCLYWVADSSYAPTLGEQCCYWDNDPFGNRFLNCSSRSNVLGTTVQYKWRLMLFDCENETLSDVTDEAITQIEPFEGTYTTLDDRDCTSIDAVAQPPFFDDPEFTCV